MRAFAAVCALGIAWALTVAPSASAASCPTASYLQYDHLAYAEVSAPAGVQLPSGGGAGKATLDHPTSSNGCKRARQTIQVMRLGTVDPRVAVRVDGRARSVFVLGQRCAGFAGRSYWGCLLHPLVFRGAQYTAISYPAEPRPVKELHFGATLGSADYAGRRVAVRTIDGVDPSLAVGISGQRSVAFLSPRTCPYGGFSNTPQYDDLLRCLRAPVWFTFDPPGNQAGGTVVARSDRPVSSSVGGASVSLVRLPVGADFVPANPRLVPVGHVADQVSLKLPNVPAGLYEAVVSCPRCSATGSGLYPAGSILVAAQPKTSLGIRLISWALIAAMLGVVIVGYRVRRRRRAQGIRTARPDWSRTIGQMLMGPGPAGSSRRGRSWSEDAEARRPARDGQGRAASPQAKRKARGGRDGRQGRNGGPRGRRPGAG